MQVIGPQEVVAVDETGRVYRSADGGATWTAAAATPPGLDAEDLHFTTLLDGWVTGFGFGGAALFHTTDGGDTWTPVPDFPGAYVAVDFEGASGWAANVSGRFYRSTDDGATWIAGRPSRLAAPDPGHGLLRREHRLRGGLVGLRRPQRRRRA